MNSDDVISGDGAGDMAGGDAAGEERDERYQRLVELAPDAVMIHDGERIVFANAAAVRLAGATGRDQLIGLPIETFLDPPYLKAVQARVLDSPAAAGALPAVRDTFRRLDGSSVEVDVMAIAFIHHARLSAHLVIRDLTERLASEQRARQADERLQQAQKMETVGSLAGGLAHEVNNMMLVVLGFSEFLLRDASLPPERRSDVHAIVNAAERAAGLTRQLLSFSRRAVTNPQVLDLAATARELEPIVRRLLTEGQQLVLECAAAPPVRADRGQLEQMIVNLALNARDAMPAGGTLTIATAEIELRYGVAYGQVEIPAGRYAHLTVSDTGVGMASETEAHIFEPFFTTKPVGQGTGLGLSAVYGIVKQNEGYIAVASSVGHGTRFSIYLPAVADAPAVGAPREAASPGRTGRLSSVTVLVVDDEPAVRQITARNLEEAGVRQVLQAADGAAALELIERHGPPNLVLTDLRMPGIGGAELARRLRERWPALPVLLMSGYSPAELRRQGFAADGEVIMKPFTPGALVAAVTAALSRALTPSG